MSDELLAEGKGGYYDSYTTSLVDLLPLPWVGFLNRRKGVKMDGIRWYGPFYDSLEEVARRIEAAEREKREWQSSEESEASKESMNPKK